MYFAGEKLDDNKFEVIDKGGYALIKYSITRRVKWDVVVLY